MSKRSDSSKLSESKKRSAEQASSSQSTKRRKADGGSEYKVDVSENPEVENPPNGSQDNNGNFKTKQVDSPCDSGTEEQNKPVSADTQDDNMKGDVDSSCTDQASAESAKCEVTGDAVKGASGKGEKDCQPSTSQKSSDLAAIAAAEALASLTGGNKVKTEEAPCSSKQASTAMDSDRHVRASSSKDASKSGHQTEAVPADSSSSLLTRNDRDEVEDAGDGDEDESLPGSSSSPSSSLASDNDEDSECAIVSVKMAPEIRQSIAYLAQVQTQLNSLEKRGARLYQRLEVKLERQRRPHLDQRSSITQTIPGFWVTALLNHPYLSPHIDENDEDALSYMTNLEIESFKSNKPGYRIRFHFRRNPYFQNTVLMKELHLGVDGSPVSMSNRILWHRGQDLTGPAEFQRSTRGGYQSFFSWFGDHSYPGRDDIAQILKDDLYRNPLRYYLTPLWHPRENGSAPKPASSSSNTANRNGSGSGSQECVVISDSDDDEPEESSQESCREGKQTEDDEDEEEHEGRHIAGWEDSNIEVGESSHEERDEEVVDVEEMGSSQDSRAGHTQESRDEEEDDVDVDEEGDQKDN